MTPEQIIIWSQQVRARSQKIVAMSVEARLISQEIRGAKRDKTS